MNKITIGALTMLNVILLCAFDNLADGELLMYGLLMRILVLALIIGNAAAFFWCVFGLIQNDPTSA